MKTDRPNKVPYAIDTNLRQNKRRLILSKEDELSAKHRARMYRSGRIYNNRLDVKYQFNEGGE
jgi:hypothetical protein